MANVFSACCSSFIIGKVDWFMVMLHLDEASCLAVIGAFQRCVPSAVCCCINLLLWPLHRGFHVSGISFPSALLILLR